MKKYLFKFLYIVLSIRIKLSNFKAANDENDEEAHENY